MPNSYITCLPYGGLFWGESFYDLYESVAICEYFTLKMFIIFIIKCCQLFVNFFTLEKLEVWKIFPSRITHYTVCAKKINLAKLTDSNGSYISILWTPAYMTKSWNGMEMDSQMEWLNFTAKLYHCRLVLQIQEW